jgi:predicted amidophosphoribosyltransferase
MITFGVAVLDRLGQLLLPLRCLVCGAPGQAGLDLCSICAAELPWNDCACARCALPLAVPAAACGECLAKPPAFEHCIPMLRYESPLDRLLPRFKFHAGLAQGRLLSQLMQRRLEPAALRENIDAIVPMPLHRQRLGQRGYNQALELARPLAKALNIELDPAALRRLRATAAQTDLDADARRRNVRGAFAADGARASGRRKISVTLKHALREYTS